MPSGPSSDLPGPEKRKEEAPEGPHKSVLQKHMQMFAHPSFLRIYIAASSCEAFTAKAVLECAKSGDGRRAARWLEPCF